VIGTAFKYYQMNINTVFIQNPGALRAMGPATAISAIAAHFQSGQTGRQGGSRPTGRAPRHYLRVPGVVGLAVNRYIYYYKIDIGILFAGFCKIVDPDGKFTEIFRLRWISQYDCKRYTVTRAYCCMHTIYIIPIGEVRLNINQAALDHICIC